MATVNNILGQRDIIQHVNGTKFDKTFTVTLDSGSAFDALTGYTHSFKIFTAPGGTELYSKTGSDSELTISSTQVRINDKLDLSAYGKLYFEWRITSTTDAERIFVMWYGDFYNER
jgi:hypothetical protein